MSSHLSNLLLDHINSFRKKYKRNRNLATVAKLTTIVLGGSIAFLLGSKYGDSDMIKEVCFWLGLTVAINESLITFFGFEKQYHSYLNTTNQLKKIKARIDFNLNSNIQIDEGYYFNLTQEIIDNQNSTYLENEQKSERK